MWPQILKKLKRDKYGNHGLAHSLQQQMEKLKLPEDKEFLVHVTDDMAAAPDPRPGSPFQHILADLLTGQHRPSGGSRKWDPDGHRSLATTEGPVRSQDASSQRHEREREREGQ